MADKILKSITFPGLPDKYIIPETTVDSVPTQGSTNAVSSGGMYDEIEEIQNNLVDLDALFPAVRAVRFESGGIGANGGVTSSNTRIRTRQSGLTQIKTGDCIYVDATYEAKAMAYTNPSISSTYFIEEMPTGWFNGLLHIPSDYGGKYIGILIRKVGQESADISADVDTISDHIKYYSNKNGIESLTALNNVPSIEWEYNKIVSAQGAINNSQYYAITQIIDCSNGDIFYNHTPTADSLSGLSCYHVLYKTTETQNDTFYQRVGASSTRKMVIPEDVTGYRFMFGRSTSGGVPISAGDAENNVDLEVWRKGPGYGYLDASIKKSIKMLCIGNSYSQDSVAYMPFILSGLAENINLTLGIAYYGGGTITNYKGFFDNDSAEITYNYLKPNSTAWASASEKQTLKQILAAEPWDIVTFQQGSKYQESWGNYGDLIPLIDRVIGYLSATHGKSVRAGWLMPQIRYNTSTTDSYANMIGCVKKVLETTPVSFVIPCGTAIHLARQTELDNLGDGGHLTYEGVHLQEGLPCLISAYVSTIKMLEFVGQEYKSILGEQTRPIQTWIDARNIPGQNGDSVGVTESNCYLAQKLATQAVKFPYGEETA